MIFCFFKMAPAFLVDRDHFVGIKNAYRFDQVFTVHGVFAEAGEIAELNGADMKNTRIDFVSFGHFIDTLEIDSITGNVNDAVFLSIKFNNKPDHFT